MAAIEVTCMWLWRRPARARRVMSMARGLPPESLGQRARVGWHIDRVALEDVERDDLQRPLVRGGQHDERPHPRLVRAQPVARGDTPSVARLEPREAVLGKRRTQVV